MEWTLSKEQSVEAQPDGVPFLTVTEAGCAIIDSMGPSLRDWALTWAFLFRSTSNALAYTSAVVEEFDALRAASDLSKQEGNPLANLDVCSFWEMSSDQLTQKTMGMLRRCLALSTPMQFMSLAAVINKAGPDKALPADKEEEMRNEVLEPSMLAAIFATRASMSAHLYFGKSMNELLVEADNGNLTALLNAVRVDPTVLGCPTASKIIQRVGVAGPLSFFTQLSTALTSRLTIDQQHDADLQFYLSLIAKSGFMSRLSYKAAQLIFLEVTPPLYESRDENGPETLARKVRAYKSKRTVLPEKSSSV